MPPPTQRLNPQWPFLLGSPQSVTVYTDYVSGTVILGGSLAEFATSPPAAFSPAQVKLNPNPQWPFWVSAPAIAPAAPSVVYADVVTGVIIFGGSVAEFTTSPPPAFTPTQILPEPNPQWPFKLAGPIQPPGPAVYMDTPTGTIIFGGSVVEGKIYSDAVTGTIIFGGSLVEGKVGADAVTGTIIFGGTVYEFATSPPAAFSPAQVKLNPNPQWPFWVPAPAIPIPPTVIYLDIVTGTLIFGGSVVESYVPPSSTKQPILYIQNQLFRRQP